MKKLLFLLLIAVSFLNCEDDGLEPVDATIIDRWHLVGFDDAVLYEFTEDKRYTFYSDGGGFPTLDPNNPPALADDWEYDGDVVVIDLSFGNFSRLIPNFKCGNYVIDWMQEDGTYHSTTFREGYDIAECDE